MSTPGLAAFLAARPAALRQGPLAVILVEDEAALTFSLDHHLKLGFAHILALSPEPLTLPASMAGKVSNALWDCRAPAAHVGALNAVNDAVPAGTWLYYAFNAEFLFYPFCETRSIGEMLAFHAEERRAAMLTYVIDLYPADPAAIAGGPAGNEAMLPDAMLDAAGYYALARPRPGSRPGESQQFEDRQFDFHGGLRWRMQPMLPDSSRRIDRIGLFRSADGLRVTADHRFSIPEYNTLSCPWHHNLTAAITSFRVAKALARNPRLGAEIVTFAGPTSVPFAWSSAQLLDLGLIEPGQWF